WILMFGPERSNRVASFLSMESFVSEGRLLFWRRGRGRRRTRCVSTRLARRIAEVAEEIRIGPQQEARVGALEPVFISRHRAVEGEEIGILAVSLGEQAVALGIALAANLLGLRIGLGDDHGRLAVGIGADLLRLLAALGTEFGGLALPFGLH